MQKTIYNSENYTSEVRAIFGSIIYEYDIRQANINILYSYGLITDFEYQWLSLAPKQDRQYYIGKKAQMDIHFSTKKKTKSIYNQAISEGVLKARKLLVDTNGVQEQQVLRAAKDSVYVNRPLSLQTTSFDLNNNGRYITFTLRNIFTTYIRFNNGVVLLYGDNANDNNFNVDIKGINDRMIGLHQTFISALIQITYLCGYNKTEALKEWQNVYDDYVHLRCPIDMYREFVASSGFRYKNHVETQYLELPTYLPENFDKTKLDITYNLRILDELYGYIYNT